MRVLLADDQVWLRFALRLLLEYEVNIEVVGETENIRTLPRIASHLRPDLLFLDWQLPGLETYGMRQRFLTSVRAIVPHLYIIALTNDDNAKSGLLLGANAFVNKAEPPERIHTVLQRAASRMVNLRGQVADGHPLR